MSRIEAFRAALRPGEGHWESRTVNEKCAGEVTKEDFRAMLEGCLDGTISAEELLDWANLVIFNDAFSFDGEQLRDCLDRIEESDEPGRALGHGDLTAMLETLR